MLKKIFVSALVLPLITGCISFGNPKNEAPMLGNFVFENENFTMQLPADYQFEQAPESNFIKPKQDNEFPAVKIDLIPFKTNPTIDEILENEQTLLANLCGQTDACGTITDWKIAKVNGKTALKFTVNYKGRAIDVPQGFINEYHYSFPFSRTQNKPAESYLLRFSISATDLEEPLATILFDKIILTVKFK